MNRAYAANHQLVWDRKMSNNYFLKEDCTVEVVENGIILSTKGYMSSSRPAYINRGEYA